MQRQEGEEEEEEEEPIQAKPLAAQFTLLVQRQEAEGEEEEEEEEPIQAKPLAAQITPLVQRQEAEGEEEEEEEEPIQAKQVQGPAPRVSPRLATQIRSLRGGGRPLSRAERGFFEPRFGYDFSRVRIHSNGRAAEMSSSLNARAFTHGRDIVLGSGRNGSGTDQGRRLLAHELAHVIQQHAGPLHVQRRRSTSRSASSCASPTAVGNRARILISALARRNRPNVEKSYRWGIPWVFCPNPKHRATWSKLQIRLASRWSRQISKMMRRQPRSLRKLLRPPIRFLTRSLPPSWFQYQMYRRMRSLGPDLENYPVSEFVVWWGNVDKCNLWIFDVLYRAGFDFLLPDGRWPGPTEVGAGAVSGLARIRLFSEVQPGDIFWRRGQSVHHVGIALEKGLSRFRGIEYLARRSKGIGYQWHPTTGKSIGKDYRFFCVAK